MAFWRPLARGLHALTHPSRADREVDDEVRQLMDDATAAHLASGLTLEQARRAARLEVGNPAVLREEVRSSGWENVVETFVADVRYGVRRLRSNPGFAAVVILTLALGIGASTAVFSAAKPILFDSLPYPEGRRIVGIWDHGPDGARQPVTFGSFREMAERSRAFEALAVMRPSPATLTGSAEPERLDGQGVSAGYFHVLGVQPALGRGFEAADDQPNAPHVVILSDALWRRRFAADAGIIGRPIALDDDQHTVIGVMPGTFENVVEEATDIWRPLQYDATLPPGGREWGHHLRMIGRTRSPIGIAAAKRDLDDIAGTSVPEFARPPWASMARGLMVGSLQEEVTGDVKPALLAVLGAVTLLLVIVCVNVTNLLLGRAAQRRDEFALRVALGAGRLRLTRQLITESLLLTAIGGGIGVAAAAAGLQGLVAASPTTLPRATAIAVDDSVLAVALGFILLLALLVGLIPALYASRQDRIGAPHGSRHTGGHNAIRHAFVVAEVALALVILVTAGLLFRSIERLFAVPAGFDAHNRLTMQVQTSGHRFQNPNVTRAFFASALDAVRQVPGVVSADFTSRLPLSGDSDAYGVRFESVPTLESNEDRGATRYAVTPGYFETLGIPLRQGRLLEARDIEGAPLAVVLNESYARRRFPAQDAIGKRLRIGPDSGPWYTIVGVVGDVKQMSLEVNRGDAVYVTTSQWLFADSVLSLVAHTQGDPASVAPAIRRAIWSVDKDQPITRVATMESLLTASAAARRFALTLFEVFGIVALALAAFGTYGVLSGSVTERTREIGVRAALGASRRQILALVVRQGMNLTILGAVIGLAGAVAASRAVVSLLFGTSPLDPMTYVSVVAILLAVSAIACWLPAWRAAWVDPAVTLRLE
jgi:putative ABC transport system permease protein